MPLFLDTWPYSQTPGSTRTGNAQRTIEQAINIVSALADKAGVKIPWLSPIMCIKGIVEGCLPTTSDSQQRKRRSWSNDVEIVKFRLAFIVRAMYNFREMLVLAYGNEAWLELQCADVSWEDAFIRAQKLTSEEGYFISTKEYNDLMLVPHQCANRTQVSDRLLYYNRTMYFYSLNITNSSNSINLLLPFMNLSQFELQRSQYAEDLIYCQSLGYSNLIEAEFSIYDNYQKVYEDSPIGICAVVAIRLVQHYTITRQGFDAELTIENNGGDVLYNIQVTLDVKAENQTDATDRFSVGQPQISGDFNSEILPVGGVGQINWLLIPYSSAAPTQPAWYNVGGQLSYTVAGELVNITLQPDSILVEPEARLDISYFLEWRVIGSDPFSNESIVPQPFILAVLITNSGYGSAMNFRISSGQPTIVDNEKGLLVNFRITEMKINREQQTRIELSATLGNLQPFSTSTITWTMLCSLKGYFQTFNASYTETNPNGDPKLSLINSLSTHRLQHVVSLDILITEFNDSQIDYLVNEPDETETVYSSTNATLFFPVTLVQGIVQYYSIDPDTQRLVVTVVSNQTLNQSFIHLAINNYFPQYYITSSKRTDDGLDLIVNTWLSHNVDHLQSGDRIEDLLHIFDITSLPSNRSYEIILSLSSDHHYTTMSNIPDITQASMLSISGSSSVMMSVTNPTISTTSVETNDDQFLSKITYTDSSSTPQYSTLNRSIHNDSLTSFILTEERTTESQSSVAIPFQTSVSTNKMEQTTSSVTTVITRTPEPQTSFQNSISMNGMEITTDVTGQTLSSSINMTTSRIVELQQSSETSFQNLISNEETESSVPSTVSTTASSSISLSSNPFILPTTGSSYMTQWTSEATHSSTSSEIIQSTSTSTISISSYIRFILSLFINDLTLTADQIGSELLNIFLSALDIRQNRINITVMFATVRTVKSASAQIRLNDDTSESAYDLLGRVRQQLSNSSSSLRSHNLTSQLNNESISDVQRWYICENDIEQQAPCSGTIASAPTASTSTLSTILVATIIPSVFGMIVVGAIVTILVKYFRRHSDNSCPMEREYDALHGHISE